MTQSWHDLLFAHWPVPPAVIAPKIPQGLTLDLFAGMAWVGVVPFHMSGVKLRGVLGVPTATAFPEINVRTYVVRDGKPGVYFFSLDAESRLAVAGARQFFHLPYFHANITTARTGEWIEYHSVRTATHNRRAEFRGRYRPIGGVRSPQSHTLEHWLAERYCLYTAGKRGSILRGDIHHPPWPLQLAEADIEVNTLPRAAGVELPTTAPLLHFARRLDVLIWPLVRA